ncbi:MAG TPA: hypothetical protein VMF58_10595 [Rhizomicrobium sp.]|nr:hypothetical protein [Rhizomicrobium sp.]
MKNSWIAPLIGAAAGLALAGVWFGAPYAGLHIQPATIVAIAAILAFATSTATFALMAFQRPAPGGDVRTSIHLDEAPATNAIFAFSDENLAQIVVKPEMPLAAALARFGATFNKPASEMNKNIIVTIKASRHKTFATATLPQLFLMLKSFKLLHVLLLDDRDRFIAYIPGARALKEFTGNDAVEKITKYITSVLENPERSEVVHELGGAAQLDTIRSSQDLGDARKELWKSEQLQGLVVMRKLKPIGYIRRLDVLDLASGPR